MNRRSALGSVGVAVAAMASWFSFRSMARSAPAATPDPQQAEWERKAAEIRATAIAAMPYPRVETTGANALAMWEQLKAEARGWPVVIGGDEDLARVAEQLSIKDGNTVAEVLASASMLMHPASLQALRDSERISAGDDVEVDAAPLGVWPSATSPSPRLSVAADLDGRPLAKVHILLLPTQESAAAPAFLRWGGWNECPAPEYHVAALRSWHERYGAEVVGMSGDVINLRVRSRPGTQEEALVLAREQFLYCEDIVLQGVDALRPLGATLMADDWWFFWWD